MVYVTRPSPPSKGHAIPFTVQNEYFQRLEADSVSTKNFFVSFELCIFSPLSQIVSIPDVSSFTILLETRR